MRFVERDLVPFSPEPLRGERLLVLAPHPDDEVIGCGGLVALHAREGRRVHVIVATDGGEAERGDVSREEYVATREAETNAGLAELGVAPAEFLRIPDRYLEHDLERLTAILEKRLGTIRPDLIVVPSPIEIHPDHAALARGLIELVQRNAELAATLALARIAFMEVTQPIRPNVLVDVSAVLDGKERAIRKHASQQATRDYASFALGLSRFRTMTLPPGTEAAEAFYITDAAWLRTHALSELQGALRGHSIEVAAPATAVTVIIRTHDRPALLAQAVESVRAASEDAAIVIVNDGTSDVPRSLAERGNIRVLENAKGSGRSAAMNRGVDAAETEWIAFLDDDDLYYPEHLSVLLRAANERDGRGWYTDAVSVVYETGDDGELRATERRRTYAREYDADLLLLDNFVPLPTLLVRREDFVALGGFDPAFDLFEDWDFVLRLASRGPLVRVPRLTCEIRHFSESESAVLRNPAGSSGYIDAKLKIWRKHGLFDDPAKAVRGIEALKRTASAQAQRLHEELGRGAHLERDVARLERDKESLVSSLGGAHARVAELEEHIASLGEQIARRDESLVELHADRGRLDARARELQEAVERSTGTTRQLYDEIARLNELIAEMHRTRAWRLHRALERIRGR